MSSTMYKVGDLIDKLTLDALTLMEKEIQMKIQVENAMCGGETHLAKSRYILGQNSVSSLQLPTDMSPDFEATVIVKTEQLDGGKQMVIENVRKDDQTDPVRWFGYLVPQDLYGAQTMFRQALQWILQAVNVQIKLVDTCRKIAQLQEVKKSMIKK